MRVVVWVVLVGWCVWSGPIVPRAVAAGTQTGLAASAGGLSGAWKRIPSEHFTVVGDAVEGDLRATLLELERFRLALLHVFPGLDVEPPLPTIVVVFKHDAEFTLFKPREASGVINRQVAGYFIGLPDMNYIVSASHADRQLQLSTILHEYTHFVVYRNFHRAPAWLHEGLAEFFAMFRSDREGRGVVGYPLSGREEAFRAIHEGQTMPMPLRRLFLPGPPISAYERQRASSLYYAQAWALTHYLLLGERHGQLVPYLDAVATGLPIEQAFRQTFNVSFEAMEQEVANYVQSPRLRVLRVPGPADAASIGREPAERMREADVAQLRGDLLMRLGAYREAERELSRALEIDAGHATARTSLAALRIGQQRHAEALALLEEMPEDPAGALAAHYARGRAFAGLGRHGEAFVAFYRAVLANGRSPAAWLELGIAALAIDRDSDADLAFERLRALDGNPVWHRTLAVRAFRLGRDEVALRAVDAYLDAGGFGENDVVYAGIVGALASWRTGRHEEAEVRLARLEPYVVAGTWMATVHQFLIGRIPAQRMISRAGNPEERTHAYAYAGFAALLAGRPEEARRHLTWVGDRGVRPSLEYDLAMAALEQLSLRVQGTGAAHP